MSAKVIVDPGGPKAGPYSPAVVSNGLVFVSGQIGFSPETGKLVDDSVEGQLRQAFSNVSQILEAAGATLDRVVKVTVYLTDLGAFGDVNRVFSEVFPDDPPARTTVEVAALPLGALVELDVVAALGDSSSPDP